MEESDIRIFIENDRKQNLFIRQGAAEHFGFKINSTIYINRFFRLYEILTVSTTSHIYSLKPCITLCTTTDTRTK